MEDQKEMLTLKDLEEKYGFNPNTIMRERWEMKKVKQQKPKCENGKYYLKIKAKDGSEYTQEVNSSGFGFSVPATRYGRVIKYKRKLVEDWINNATEDLSPEERVNKTA